MPMDEIILRDKTAVLTMPDGKAVKMSLAELFRRAAPRRIDTCGIGLAREVCFAYSRGPSMILVCEYPAGPYTLSWIANDSPSRYGSGAKYRRLSLSLPYVIVLAAFEGTRLSDYNECFFRTAPLTDIDSENELLFPGLLNCSRFEPPQGKPLSWICTQKLDRAPIQREKDDRRRIRAGLHALKHCLFDTGFNYSSDVHEHSSWYTESRGVDSRIETADRWSEETKKDRFFGLDVPWLETGMNLPQVVERICQNQGIHEDHVRNAQQLTRLIINHHGG